MKSLTAIFTGTVQGVGFRFTTERLARRYQVTGYVKNLANGHVELTAEGEEKELQAFLKAVQESSLASYIQEVNVQWSESAGKYETFEITF